MMVFSFKRTLASSSAPAECLNRVVLMCFNSPLAALLIIRRLLVQRMPIAKWKGDELPFPRFMDTLSVTWKHMTRKRGFRGLVWLSILIGGCSTRYTRLRMFYIDSYLCEYQLKNEIQAENCFAC